MLNIAGIHRPKDLKTEGKVHLKIKGTIFIGAFNRRVCISVNLIGNTNYIYNNLRQTSITGEFYPIKASTSWQLASFLIKMLRNYNACGNKR